MYTKFWLEGMKEDITREDIIRMSLKEIRREGVGWIHLDKDQ